MSMVGYIPGSLQLQDVRRSELTKTLSASFSKPLSVNCNSRVHIR